MIKSIIQWAMAVLVVGPLNLSAQVTVGGTTPDPSAVVDMQSTDKGFLWPRLSTSERNAISSPATGLIIFNTNTLCIEINQGTPSTPQWEKIKCRTGVISTLDCSTSTVTGPLSAGQSASGVSVSVPYTGGNGGYYAGQTVTSTGVTGLTASLSAGNLSTGAGTLTYSITGTPASGGTASFALNSCGQTCTLNALVCSTGCCAKISATEYKHFMCHNLGVANMSADPFTPSWEIIGGYWQWGKKLEAAPGPTASDPKADAIIGWNTSLAANGSWIDNSKTANDPCPAGYRVPTKSQWDAVISSNTLTNVGTWSTNGFENTNYSSGKMVGNNLFLPAAGYKTYNTGASRFRGGVGYYWSTTVTDSSNAWSMRFTSGIANSLMLIRSYGIPIRCIEE